MGSFVSRILFCNSDCGLDVAPKGGLLSYQDVPQQANEHVVTHTYRLVNVMRLHVGLTVLLQDVVQIITNITNRLK